MKVKVDHQLCISCGACINLSPSVFDWNGDEKAKTIVDEVPEKVEGDTISAIESCPTDAIEELA